MPPFRIAILITLLAGVAGCVLPPAFTIASLVADGISMASSGKTVTDQAISLLAHKDCRLWRLVQGKSICRSDTSVVAVAVLPRALALHAASPGLRPTEPSVPAMVLPVKVAPAEPVPSPEAQLPAAVSSTPTPEPPPSSAIATAAPAIVPPRQKIPPALAAPARQTPASSVAAAPPSPMRRAGGDARVRGEMVIRSGAAEAEARALAASLHAAGATVRPVRQGGVTIYEVVMGLSG